jgi:EAL and modified HD-GYP domain-containing signal transduction protein
MTATLDKASMPQDQIYLGRQPILDAKQATVAYELLFRSGNSVAANVTDDLLASANVIINTISQFGIDQVLGSHLGFINVSYELLMSDMIELLPPGNIVLEILETVEIDDRVVERCRELKAKGFRLALDDFVYHPSYEPLFELADIVKFDVMLSSPEAIAQNLKILRKHANLRFLAEKVEDQAQFQRYLKAGFALFQGYFFARPAVITTRKANPSQMILLRVMGMILSDAEVEQIEKTFKQSPNLSIGLLRLVNSVGMGLSRQVGSLQQALVVLGQRQLLRWVQLLLYSHEPDGASSPLFQLAAARARLMETVSVLCKNNSTQSQAIAERAFMVGILSLSDVLLGMKMEDILGQLGLIEDVRSALLKREGFLGGLLTLSEKMETGDFEVASSLLQELGLSTTDLGKAQLEAMQWAANLGEQANN